MKKRQCTAWYQCQKAANIMSAKKYNGEIGKTFLPGQRQLKKKWQRYNIPKGRVLSPNTRICFWVISQVLDQNSASEYDRTSASLSEPKSSFKIATLIQPHNLDQASASKSRTKFSRH